MPSLVVRLTSAEQTIDISRNAGGFKHLYLVGYRGTGMAAGNPTLYFRIEPQATIANYGNCQSRFPLYFSSTDDRNGWMGALGIPITGKHSFNESRMLRFIVSNHDGSAPVFTTLELHFLGLDTFYPAEASFTEIDFVNFAA